MIMQIIEEYHADKLKGKLIFDFLNNISGTPSDQLIMDNWKAHFRRKKKIAPFIITSEPCKHYACGFKYRLWKLQEVHDNSIGGVVFNNTKEFCNDRSNVQ
jgi:hypothetical protein